MSILDKHKENVFETEIVAYLTTHEWMEGTSQGYDRNLALYPEDLLTYIKSTQPDAYEKMLKREGAKTDDVLLKFVAKELDSQGSLHYLRHEL